MANRTVAVISDGAWIANTAYSLGDTVSNDTLKIYKCITAGTSASSGGPTGTGQDITDNTVHWKYMETVEAAYTSLNSALSGQSADLVTNTRLLTINCYAFQDTTRAGTGTGYTTNDSYYINIVVPTTERHIGKWDTSKYYLNVSSLVTNGALSIEEAYTRVTGVQCTFSGTTEWSMGFRVASTNCRVDKCIFKPGTTTMSYCGGIDFTTAATSGHVRNSLSYDFSGSVSGYAFGSENTSGSIYAYNCTAVDCSHWGFVGTSAAYMITKNCGASNCGTEFSYCTQTTCSDSTPTFQDSGTDDFHLDSSDTTWLGQGTNLYNDATYPFQDDIDGEDRGGSGFTWDIGADEYVSGVIAGTTCWGHSTGVTETNTRTFVSHGSGTGTIENSGDTETLVLAPGEYWEFETISTNGEQNNVTITLNQYRSGDSVTIKYRTGATQSACEAASWSTYSAPFTSSGFVGIRLEG